VLAGQAGWCHEGIDGRRGSHVSRRLAVAGWQRPALGAAGSKKRAAEEPAPLPRAAGGRPQRGRRPEPGPTRDTEAPSGAGGQGARARRRDWRGTETTGPRTRRLSPPAQEGLTSHLPRVTKPLQVGRTATGEQREIRTEEETTTMAKLSSDGPCSRRFKGDEPLIELL